MKRTIFLLMVLVLFSCGDRDDSMQADVVVPVSVEEISLKAIQQFVSTTGTVKAIKEVTLRTESTGYYRLLKNPGTNAPFAMGNLVKKGQMIVSLDNPELESSIKIESQELNLDISEREYEKQKSLYKKGGVTLRELKNAERSFIDARYAYDNAIIQLDKLKITAPFKGILVDLTYYTPGTKVEANSEITQIMDYSQLFTEVNLPYKEMNRVTTGQNVSVTNYTQPEDTLRGMIEQVAPALDPVSRTFKATILIDNPELIIRPGMFMKIDIVVSDKDQAIVIPKDVIISRRGEKTVYVVEKGAAIRRTISTGLENKEQIEIVDGLKENERLVVKGFETLRNRSKVKIVQ